MRVDHHVYLTKTCPQAPPSFSMLYVEKREGVRYLILYSSHNDDIEKNFSSIDFEELQFSGTPGPLYCHDGNIRQCNTIMLQVVIECGLCL